MPDLVALSIAAVSIGFFHTLLGPDHYLPFVAMSRVGGWSLKKTTLITVLCGLGHVLSSVVLGCIGIAFGVAVLKLEHIEGIRGDLAGWLLLTFGLIYFSWGLARAIRNRPHLHLHEDGTLHAHEVLDPATQVAERGSDQRRAMTPWVLFTIFLFGPCEPLIPMLMYPAATGSSSGVLLVTLLFGVTTIATMLGVVMLMYLGANVVGFGKLGRYSHALAGLVVLGCGMAIKLGL
jgi:sulfite exporter TauE/SafE